MVQAVLAIVVVLGTACEATERITIRADGSASVMMSVEVTPGDPTLEAFGSSYDELASRANNPAEEFDERQFFVDQLALDDDDTILDNLSLDIGDDRATFTFATDVPDLDSLVALVAERGNLFLALSGLSVINDSGTSVTLRADAVGNVTEHLRGLLALDGDPFEPGIADHPDIASAAEMTFNVELVLPGRIIAHDAHDADGNTLHWSWTIGEPAGPGLSVSWDPLADSDTDFDWWGRSQVSIYGIVMLTLLVLAVVTSMRKSTALD